MLADEKWIDYAIKTLEAADTGANSISHIHDQVGGSKTYLAKVIASLRRSGLIDKSYELPRSLDNISVRDVLLVDHDGPEDSFSEITSHLKSRILQNLDFSVRELL